MADGMYYTPKEIERIANPSTGTGAFLSQAVDGLSNPPYAAEHRVHWTLRLRAVVKSIVIWASRQ